MAADVPLFNKDKHVQYWLRCLRTPLPTAYTSNDTNRMMLSFFILSALDILGVLFTRTSPSERKEYADWIYNCQHPKGGFRGFSGSDFGKQATNENEVWDPANLAATFFALSALCVLGDDLQAVDRRACLQWLRSMQRRDGSFGELKDHQNKIVGGGDPRFLYMAAGIRWVLRGDVHGAVDGVPDLDLGQLQDWVAGSQTREGAYSKDADHESHAGLTFCAIAAHSILGHSSDPLVESSQARVPNVRHQSALQTSKDDETIRWLTHRLTTAINETDEDLAEHVPTSSPVNPTPPLALESDHVYLGETLGEPSFVKISSRPVSIKEANRPYDTAEEFLEECQKPVSWTGFCGRCNKVADTCYVFWVGASLKMLGGLDFVDLEHTKCYLLDKTQHLIMGGFGKTPSDLPDIYHAYLGLAALSLINGHKRHGAYIGPDIEDASKVVEGQVPKAESATRKGDTDRTVRALDPILCISTSAREWIESFEWRKGARTATPDVRMTSSIAQPQILT